MKHFLTTLCFLVLASTLNAQHAAFENLTPLSPTTTEMQKYGNYPVGHYTGVPNISIPLYTIVSGGIEVPITLSYHASGIKTDQEASWVGLGWSLNAGGSISRQIRGYDDFMGRKTDRSTYFFSPDIIPLTEDNKNNTGFTSAQVSQYAPDFHVYDRDFHPDLYFYNFTGYAGEIIFDNFPYGVPTKRGDGLLFETNLTDDSRDFNDVNVEEGFIARGLDGNKYNFFKKEQIRTSNQNIPTNPEGDYITAHDRHIGAWHLTSIISNTNKEISFEYYTDYGAPVESVHKTNATYSIPTGHTLYDNARKIIPIPNNCSIQGSDTSDICQSYTAANIFPGNPRLIASNSWSDSFPIYLQEISSDEHRVVFNREARSDLNGDAERLASIEIYDKKNRLIKGVKFNYGYTNNFIAHINSHRHSKLILESIEEYNKVNSTIVYKAPYQFDYYTAGSRYYKDTHEFDSWGYPNSPPPDDEVSGDISNIVESAESVDAVGNVHIRRNDIDTRDNLLRDITTHREEDFTEVTHQTDADRSKLYTLNKIIYPTGGSTAFEFESNDYRNSYENYMTVYLEGDGAELIPLHNNLNNKCQEAPCSTVTKQLYKLQSINPAPIWAGDERKPDNLTRSFVLTRHSVVVLDFELRCKLIPHYKSTGEINYYSIYDLFNQNFQFDIRGTLKNENMQPLFSIEFNNALLNQSPNAVDAYGRFTSNINTNGTKDYKYHPKKAIKLPPGTYYYQIENPDNQPSHNAYFRVKALDPILEDNRFNKGGGIRVASISNFDSDDTLVSKTTYDYTGEYEDESVDGNRLLTMSSGKLLAPVNYNYEHSHVWISPSFNDQIHNSVEKIFSFPRPLTPMASSANGQSIGYDHVTETKIDPENNTLGKTVYYYKNELETLAGNPTNTPNNKHYDNGQLKNQQSFNTQNELVYEQVNHYKKDPEVPFVYGINMRQGGKDMPNHNDFTWAGDANNFVKMVKFTDYKIRSEWWYMDHSQETFYDLEGQEAIVTSTSYEYANNKSYQPTKTTVTTSKGDTVETVVHYPDDIETINSIPLGGPLTQAEFDAIERLKGARIVNGITIIGEEYQPATPVQTQTTYSNSSSVERNHFTVFGPENQSDTTLLSNNTTANEGQLITLISSISNATGDTSLEKQVEYILYDHYGNPRELKRENGIHAIYLWGYKGEHLIAKIENASYSTLSDNIKGPNGLFNQAINYSNDLENATAEASLRDKLEEIRNHSAFNKSMITTYMYDPLIGMTTMKDPRGYKTSYTYDVHNRLHQIRNNEGNVVSENIYHYKNQN